MTLQPEPGAVGFIGLGALGTPMAANLLAAGYNLHVHNRTAAAADTLLASGAVWAADPAETARSTRVLCLCLSDDAAVTAVLAAARPGLRRGALVIDFSTISPATSQNLAAELAESGIGYLDAPVTGGTEGAQTGTLSMLVGGTAANLERARPLLAVVGGCISHLGPVGSGQQAKAVNQVLVAGSYGAVAEALALGRSLGLPMEILLQALRPGAAGSWALDNRADGMLAGHYPLGFKLALHRKDLGIALASARSQGLELPLSERIAAIEDALINAGLGEHDVSALAEWFRG